MSKKEGDKIIQAHLSSEEYADFKAIAEKKDWSDKKLNEKMVKLIVKEIKSKPTRINDL